jgi:hypothetical protein
MIPARDARDEVAGEAHGRKLSITAADDTPIRKGAQTERPFYRYRDGSSLLAVFCQNFA